MDLTTYLAQLVTVYSKVIEGSHKGKNVNFWTPLLIMYILEVVTLFSCLVVMQSTQFFSGSIYC